ncbi:MAG: hypothetical protein AAB263_11245 [Planctomycetota bacterium]
MNAPELIEGFLDHQLSDAETTRLEQLLATDPAFAAEFDEALRMAGMLSHTLHRDPGCQLMADAVVRMITAGAGAAFSDRVIEVVKMRPSRRVRRAARRGSGQARRWWLLAALAALICLILTVRSAWSDRRPIPDESPADAAQQEPTISPQGVPPERIIPDPGPHVPTPAVDSKPAKNLLTCPGFETEDHHSWNRIVSDKATIVRGISHTGERALRVTRTSDYHQDCNLSSTRLYEAGVWFQLAGSAADLVSIRVHWLRDERSVISMETISGVTGTRDWTHVGRQIIAPPQATKARFVVNVRSADGTDVILLDDAEFRPVSP